jgi:hypothetical protein
MMMTSTAPLALALLLLALPVPAASASSAAVVDTASMWRELEAHCAQGRCSIASGSRDDDSGFSRWVGKGDELQNTTECKGRMLAYEYGLKTLPARAPQLESFDALELEDNCGVTRPTELGEPLPVALSLPAAGVAFHVDYARGDDGAEGSERAPFQSIHRALAATRAAGSAGAPKSIVLKAGVHYLNATIELGAQDSGLTLTAAPGAEGKVTVSGGVKLSPSWTKSTRGSASANIWESEVPELSGIDKPLRGLTTLEPHRRVTRAREPNADPAEGAELCKRCWHNKVVRWHSNLDCIGTAATVYKDLRDCDAEHKIAAGPLQGQPCKNDSAMWNTYNTYSNGHGGCCAAWSGDASPYGPQGDYFCGNSSAGGWVGHMDPRGDNKSQGLSAQLPWGFDFDPTDELNAGPFLASMKDPAGAIFHVWRAQGWFVNMFEIASSDPSGKVEFATAESYGVTHPKGGWQGGRGWQVNGSAINDTSTEVYLLASKWMIENVFEALDVPNEWYHQPDKSGAGGGKLYLIPNASLPDPESGSPPSTKPPPADTSYVAVLLETLVSINGTKADPVRNVTVQGITFRDAADITMEPWGVPSGGDWGLYRGGAIFIEGAEGISIQHNTLTRLDGNGVFVSGYTRDVTINDNEFSWIGCSPMASWGYTDENDGMDGQQPRYTYVLRNYVREFGHYEKQSSFWSNNKACLAQIEGNVVFNGPRAGINFNDGFGGGTNVTKNLIYNQCRESGDHGAMNAWDRTAYLSDVKYGEASYEAQMNSVDHNFIIANYGASQGFDTDDGSSWYDIHDNFFFLADAWKMDYGGHDSRFTGNVVYHGANDGQNCVNTWPFLAGHGAVWEGNRCILPRSNNLAGSISTCDCPGPAAVVPWNASDLESRPPTECGKYCSAL